MDRRQVANVKYGMYFFQSNTKSNDSATLVNEKLKAGLFPRAEKTFFEY